MKKSRNRVVVKTNRGHTLIMTTCYAKDTPEGFWGSVYGALEHVGVFEGIR